MDRASSPLQRLKLVEEELGNTVQSVTRHIDQLQKLSLQKQAIEDDSQRYFGCSIDELPEYLERTKKELDDLQTEIEDFPKLNPTT